MAGKDRFDFGGAESLAGNLDRVVAAAEDVPETIVVHGGPVAVNPDIRETRPVGFQVALRIIPETARHADPRLPEDEFTDLPAHGVAGFVHDIGGHTGQRTAEGARFHRREHVAHENAAGDFGAAAVVDDGKFSFADFVEQPQPRFGIPRLAGGTEFAKRGQIMFGQRLPKEAAHERRGNAECRDAVTFNQRPQAVAIERAVVEHHRRAEKQRTKDFPRPHHPAHVSYPEQGFVGVKIESHPDVGCGFDREAAMRVDRALGFAGGTGSVNDHQRIFGAGRLGW